MKKTIRLPHGDSSGFSLVELSIVLVILGLLVGGVLTGRALIKSAELRSINTEYEQWQTAVYTFREKYRGLPGDLANAQSFWGVAASCPPAAGTVLVGTCNGDGDGIIGNHLDMSEIYEQFTFWQHLQKAGLISGDTYSGSVGTASAYQSVVGVNVPRSKFGNAGWTARYRNSVAGGDPSWFAGNYGNAYVFGAQTTTITHGGVLTPEEAWNLDVKFDDGKPATGNIIVRPWGSCTNAVDGQDLQAAYTLTSKSVVCSLNFRAAQ